MRKEKWRMTTIQRSFPTALLLLFFLHGDPAQADLTVLNLKEGSGDRQRFEQLYPTSSDLLLFNAHNHYDLDESVRERINRNHWRALRRTVGKQLREWYADSPLARSMLMRTLNKTKASLQKGVDLGSKNNDRNHDSLPDPHRFAVGFDIGKGAVRLSYDGYFSAVMNYSPISDRLTLEILKKINDNWQISLNSSWEDQDQENMVIVRRPF